MILLCIGRHQEMAVRTISTSSCGLYCILVPGVLRDGTGGRDGQGDRYEGEV